MFNVLRVVSIFAVLPWVTGCAGFINYIERMQAQPVDYHFNSRSVNFKPRFQVDPPRRTSLTPQQQRLVGAAPPQQGEVVLDGVERYYSANGYVCQYFTLDKRANQLRPQAACWIGGQWVLSAPVLNTQPELR